MINKGSSGLKGRASAEVIKSCIRRRWNRHLTAKFFWKDHTRVLPEWLESQNHRWSLARCSAAERKTWPCHQEETHGNLCLSCNSGCCYGEGSWTDLFTHRASALSLFRHSTFYIRPQIQISKVGRLESKLSVSHRFSLVWGPEDQQGFATIGCWQLFFCSILSWLDSTRSDWMSFCCLSSSPRSNCLEKYPFTWQVCNTNKRIHPGCRYWTACLRIKQQKTNSVIVTQATSHTNVCLNAHEW